MDTHTAVRMLTAAGADETLAVAVLDVAQNAAARGRESATRAVQHWRFAVRSLVFLALLLWLVPTTLAAQIFPDENGEALSGVEEFDARVSVKTWLNMDGDASDFQSNAENAFILALRRDGIRVERDAPNYLFCDIWTAERQSLVAYVWQLGFYLFNPEGVHLLVWSNGGIVTVGASGFTWNTATEECANAFASEWLRWNPRR